MTSMKNFMALISATLNEPEPPRMQRQAGNPFVARHPERDTKREPNRLYPCHPTPRRKHASGIDNRLNTHNAE
jgi:hypothetical protein